MSTAARKLAVAGHDPVPRVRPSRTPAARPPRATPPRPHRRARRGSPFAFWILVAVVAGVLIIGIASLSALLVQTSFQGDDLQTQLSSLQQQHEVLREQVARLFAATDHGVGRGARDADARARGDPANCPPAGDGGA